MSRGKSRGHLLVMIGIIGLGTPVGVEPADFPAGGGRRGERGQAEAYSET